MEEVQKTQEAEFDAKFNAKDYKKSTFSFLANEARELSSYDTIAKTAQLMQADAQRLIGGVVNVALKRVAVKDSPAVQVLYDAIKGTFMTWEPRQWCSVCNNAKAEFQFNDKVYCETCIVPVREQQAKDAVEKSKLEPKGAKKK